ncbi:nuclear transcription factor Y subunit beta isoform X2 [Hydra vulgaris]|uniref:Nuclear transcription factor Y subunit beta isoform X2 n=1 Tax=Hydra vulgaris TaxID=6087 RepID=A0ABM4DJ28_HYDVU
MQVDERPSILIKHEASMTANEDAQAEYQENLEDVLKQAHNNNQSTVLIMQQHLHQHRQNVSSSNIHNSGVMNSETDEQDYSDELSSRDKDELREQDRFLPIANVARIMKKAIPSSGKIAKDAKECLQECLSEFISFITSEASERCQQEKRKTINGEDILFAMTTLGFDNYVEPLKVYLTKYRESIKGEKILGMGEYSTGDEASMTHTLQYDVGSNSMHPMVSNDGTYAYTQAQVSQLQHQQQQQQSLHFNT